MAKMSIKVERMWDAADVRKMCIKYSFYTRGDCEAYDKMLTFVRKNKPTTNIIYKVAEDIYNHSDMRRYSCEKDEAIAAIMFDLDRECVVSHYEINRA